MRYFIHISEFGFAGYQYLPALAFVADDLVLWAPSGLHIDKARKDGASALGPEDLLELVDGGKLRIVGRENWLVDEESRKKSDWDLAAWTEAFDGEIRKIAEADRDRPDDEQRVFFANDEKGKKWAREELAAESTRVAAVEDLIGADNALDPEKTQLLVGLAEKLADMDSPDEQLFAALRDIRNHTLASEEVEADIAVEPAAFREIVADIISSGDGSGHRALDPGPPTHSGWRELVEVVDELSPPASPADVHSLLSWKELPAVRREMDQLLCFSSPRDVLRSELGAGPRLPPWWMELNAPPLLNHPLDLLSLVLLVLGEPLAAATLPIVTRLGFAVGNASDAYGVGDERASEIAPHHGFMLPFVLAYRDPTPTYERLGELHRTFGPGGDGKLPF